MLTLCSVVSVAAVRVGMSVQDGSNDKTYSLAPDTGWMVIGAASAVVSASLPTIGPALIETWRRSRRLVTACLGSVLGPPRPSADVVDESLRRLYTTRLNGSAVSNIGGIGRRKSLREAAELGAGASSLRVPRHGGGASEQVPLHSDASAVVCHEAICPMSSCERWTLGTK